MDKASLKAWLLTTLSDFDEKDVFLVDLDWKPSSNKLVVFVDSDSDLSLERCQKINRFLERHLDESELIGSTYNLSVSSPGINRPLVSMRQYPKNVGRILKVVPKEGQEIIGKLVEVNDDHIVLQTEVKKGKHRKVQYGEAQEIALKNIKETFVEIRF